MTGSIIRSSLRSSRWANIPVVSMASSTRRLPRIAVDELVWKQLDSSQQTRAESS